jgi:hypothetical protein
VELKKKEEKSLICFKYPVLFRVCVGLEVLLEFVFIALVVLFDTKVRTMRDPCFAEKSVVLTDQSRCLKK